MTLIVNELDKSERQKKISFMVALKNHDVSTTSFSTALYGNLQELIPSFQGHLMNFLNFENFHVIRVI